jgi:hypothetical protein
LSVQVDTVGGVVHVRNAGTAPVWQLRELMTIGSEASLDARADDEFGRIASVGLSPDAELFVADQYNHEIKVFGLDGVLRQTIGRRGQGPSEFSALYSVAWVDTVMLALDFGNGRVGEFAPDGSWLGQRDAPGSVGGSLDVLRFYPVGANEVYAFSLKATPTDMVSTYVRHAASGIVSEFSRAARPEQPTSFIRCDRPDGVITFFDIPFAQRLQQHPAPGSQVAIAWTGQYRIAFLSSSGDTVRIVERQYEPAPVSDEDWEAGLAPYYAFREEWRNPSCEPRSPSKPAVKPPVSDLLIDVQGRLWVEVAAADGDRWEIFDPEGRLIAALPLFPRDRENAPYLGSDRLVYVVDDSLVPRVRVAEFGGG